VEDKMQKKSFLFGIIALLVLFVFTACMEEPETVNPTLTRRIEITNIPLVNNRGAPLFKIYLQISEGMDATAGHIAEAEVLLGGNTSIILYLLSPEGEQWAGQGMRNVGITVTPQTVSNSGDIIARGTPLNLNAETRTVNWGATIDLASSGFSAQVESLFTDVVIVDPEITYDPAP